MTHAARTACGCLLPEVGRGSHAGVLFHSLPVYSLSFLSSSSSEDSTKREIMKW